MSFFILFFFILLVKVKCHILVRIITISQFFFLRTIDFSGSNPEQSTAVFLGVVGCFQYLPQTIDPSWEKWKRVFDFVSMLHFAPKINQKAYQWNRERDPRAAASSSRAFCHRKNYTYCTLSGTHWEHAARNGIGPLGIVSAWWYDPKIPGDSYFWRRNKPDHETGYR